MSSSKSSGRWIILVVILLFIVFAIYIFRAQPESKPRHHDHATHQVSRETGAAPEPLPSKWGGAYCYGGLPRPSAAFLDTILVLTNTGYLVGYCEAKKDPAWVCYRLFSPHSQHAPPRPKEFMPDDRTHVRVLPADYSRSGFDRGHMAPNHAIAICFGAQAQEETFLMSNVIPQRPHLNREVWERLEKDELDRFAQRFGQVWVVDGPVFGKDQLRGGETVPSACYKIIIEEDQGKPQVLAFEMPQDVAGTEPEGQFLTTVDKIEHETGLNFFAELPPDIQGALEHQQAKEMW